DPPFDQPAPALLVHVAVAPQGRPAVRRLVVADGRGGHAHPRLARPHGRRRVADEPRDVVAPPVVEAGEAARVGGEALRVGGEAAGGVADVVEVDGVDVVAVDDLDDVVYHPRARGV